MSNGSMRIVGLALCAWLAMPPVIGAQTRENPVRQGEFGPFVKKIKDVQPVYSPEARRKGITGVVILDLIVGPTGRVDSVKVLRPLELVTDAAVVAARQWQYTPPTVRGKRVWMEITVSVSFPPAPGVERRRPPRDRPPAPTV